MPGLLPTDPNPTSDLHWAHRAIDLARQADYRTSPNPMVGAVVLDSSGKVVGEGYHRRAGEPHAEQRALTEAGARAAGGTMYVNLEPCSHAHRAPSCAEAIIEARISRVVISMLDPDKRVLGAGIRLLESARIETVVGAEEERARRLNEFYVKQRTTGRPFVSAKFAISLDGKIATRTGDSLWITGEAARAHGHRLRHEHDAILVGVETVIQDDPELTARVGGENPRQPLRIVIDSQLRTPPEAKVVSPNTLIATTRAGRVGVAETLQLPGGPDGRVALAPLLDELGNRGILSVLVEGGSQTHASFFEGELVDKVYAYIAPKLIGGREAPGPIGGEGIDRLATAMALREVETRQLGPDFLIMGYVDVHRDS